MKDGAAKSCLVALFRDKVAIMRAIVLVMLVCLFGCNTGQKLLGRWSGTVSGASVELEFKPGNTYSALIGKELNGGLENSGTYKVDGNSITLHPETVSNSVGTMNSGQAGLGRDMRYSITWRGDKAMTLANMRDRMELTKVD